jgi:hypothetical protein
MLILKRFSTILRILFYILSLRQQQPCLPTYTLRDTIEMVTISAKKLPTVKILKSLFNYLTIRTDTTVQKNFIVISLLRVRIRVKATCKYRGTAKMGKI